MDDRLILLRKIYDQYADAHPLWRAAQSYEDWLNKIVLVPDRKGGQTEASLLLFILDGRIDDAVDIAKSAMYYSEEG